MRCPACGRVVADGDQVCKYCFKPLNQKQPTKKTVGDQPKKSVSSLDSRKFYRLMYRLLALVGVIVVFFEAVRMVTFAVNVILMLVRGQLDAAAFGSMLTLPPVLSVIQAIVYYLILLSVVFFMGFTAIKLLTDTRDRILLGSSGGLALVVVILEICGAPAKMGVSAMTLLLFALVPFIVCCVLKEHIRATSIAFLLVCTLIPIFEIAFPPLFRAFMNWAANATSYAEFLPLFNPIFYLIFVAAYTLPTCYAFSYFSKFFQELGDAYRPAKKVKKAPKKPA